MFDFNGHALFLDRDGVINKRLVGEYVLSWEQFDFTEGAKEAIQIFSSVFQYIFVVTNQQGIGKGLMTEAGLKMIHSKMQEEVERSGGRIDGIFYCPHLESQGSFLRKPNIGMALQAKRQFPDIRFKKSVMVGDSLSDMQFGKRAGMKTVFITEDTNTAKANPHLIDYCYPSLWEFAKLLQN